MIQFILNNKIISTELPPGTVLLDLIRYQQHLKGTKIGCREGDCGACTILVGEIKGDTISYRSMTSCLMPIANAHLKHIVTIEGINFTEGLNPIQQAMADEGATQCGFCTPGFVMSLAGFCLGDKEATNSNVLASIDGNICRCTGYKSIERAAMKVADLLKDRNGEKPNVYSARKKILPPYFNDIPEMLTSLQLSAKNNGHEQILNLKSQVVGGGTDLYVQKHDEIQDASLRFVFDPPELKGIYAEEDRCYIGGSTTVTDLKESLLFNQLFPSFQKYAKLVSSTPIRNMATVAGNIINASPIGDLTVFLLALDAHLDVKSPNGHKRTIPLKNFFTGYKKLNKTQDEWIEKIWFDIPVKNQRFHFEKVSKRTHLDIATVNSAISFQLKDNTITELFISAGGIGPIPTLLKETSAFLEGKIPDSRNIEQAVEIARKEISPISDVRGSKEYKSILLGQLIKAHFIELIPELSFDHFIRIEN